MKNKRINAKQKGMRRERQCRELLEDDGYLVTKSGGSLGAFDVIAISEADVRCIQIKSNRRPPKEEMNTLKFYAKLLTNVSVELWVYKDYKGWEIEIL
jgi:Holliday junction resolvase